MHVLRCTHLFLLLHSTESLLFQARVLAAPETSHTCSHGAHGFGAAQVFARSSKFSLFDPAKEMVYIEMTAEEKSKVGGWVGRPSSG